MATQLTQVALQTAATKVVSLDSPDFQTASDMSEIACKKQCAGTVCQDPSTGSNQMLSCMQSCMMRMAGEAPETCETKCDRNGQSGCSLTAHGFTANMCGVCTDWQSATQDAKESFLRNDDCKKGCSVGKLSACEKQCAGTLCFDPTVGSNQMLSCMQACKMRMAGEGKAQCGFSCARNGQSGCSLTVKGYTANMCGVCLDWTSGTTAQQHSFVTNADCVKGCDVDDAAALE